ncbi:MAG: hypothetical protein DRN35_06020 [Thermoplasmata archaeon]|nr:MAG: hypothetical protein DRN35_06020 [Thermoplasmata archaeon]
MEASPSCSPRGVKRYTIPLEAPGRVTALIARNIIIRKRAGMRNRFILSIPFSIPFITMTVVIRMARIWKNITWRGEVRKLNQRDSVSTPGLTSPRRAT